MDVSALAAIDVHTHLHRSVTAATPEAGQALEAMAAYFKTDAIRDEIKPALYKHNAAPLLGL